MATSRELKAEISQLVSDAEPKASKPRRSRSRKKADKPVIEDKAPEPEETSDEGPGESQAPEQLKVLADKLTEFVDDAEHEIKERPVAMVLGAFALGVIVGAVLRR